MHSFNRFLFSFVETKSVIHTTQRGRCIIICYSRCSYWTVNIFHPMKDSEYSELNNNSAEILLDVFIQHSMIEQPFACNKWNHHSSIMSWCQYTFTDSTTKSISGCSCIHVCKSESAGEWHILLVHCICNISVSKYILYTLYYSLR